MQPYRILVAAAALLCVIAIAIESFGGRGTSEAASGTSTAAKPEKRGLPGGATSILPEHRVVAYYGAPQDEQLGILGIGSPNIAGIKLLRQAENYARPNKPVMPCMELIAVVSTAAPGEGDLYRARQSDKVIRTYLNAARRANAILMLDIQPGRANFLDEAKALEKWLKEPDVSLALDPEWHVRAPDLPGKVIGTVSAAEVNEVSQWLSKLVADNQLPEKMLLIHQFTDGMITNRSQIAHPPGLDLVLNADGFGPPDLKKGTYTRVTKGRGKLYTGFKLFFVEDTDLMSPDDVMSLRPQPLVVIYE